VVFRDAWWLTVGVGDVRGLLAGVGWVWGVMTAREGCRRAPTIRSRRLWVLAVFGGSSMGVSGTQGSWVGVGMCRGRERELTATWGSPAGIGDTWEVWADAHGVRRSTAHVGVNRMRQRCVGTISRRWRGVRTVNGHWRGVARRWRCG
jgi:hypothetical protein